MTSSSATTSWRGRRPAPWGPFDGGTTVATLPSDPVHGRLRYMPLAHPDLLPRPGTVVVSYSRNSTGLGRIAENPFLYRPWFLRVSAPLTAQSSDCTPASSWRAITIRCTWLVPS